MEDIGEHLKDGGNIFQPIDLACGVTQELAPRPAEGGSGAHPEQGEWGLIGAG